MPIPQLARAGFIFAVLGSSAAGIAAAQDRSPRESEGGLLTSAQPGIGSQREGGPPPPATRGLPQQGPLGREQAGDDRPAPIVGGGTTRPRPLTQEAEPNARQIPQLTEYERDLIRRTVTEKKVLSPSEFDLPARPGDILPPTTIVHDLPTQVITEVPSYSRFKFAMDHNRILIVDPVNMRIVNVIPLA